MKRKYTNAEHLKRIDRQINQKYARIRKIHDEISKLIDKNNEIIELELK